MVDIAIVSRRWRYLFALAIVLSHSQVRANGHGPVFGAATPTLGRGGWSVDQAYTFRAADGPDDSQQMFKTMVSFGITETVQVSASIPIAMPPVPDWLAPPIEVPLASAPEPIAIAPLACELAL